VAASTVMTLVLTLFWSPSPAFISACRLSVLADDVLILATSSVWPA